MLQQSWDLWCDVCGCWVHPAGLRGRPAIAWAKREGWTRTVNPVCDTCPQCNGTNTDYWRVQNR